MRESAPANRATRLEGLKHSPPLHATHLTGTVSGLREQITLANGNYEKNHLALPCF